MGMKHKNPDIPNSWLAIGVSDIPPFLKFQIVRCYPDNPIRFDHMNYPTEYDTITEAYEAMRLMKGFKEVPEC